MKALIFARVLSKNICRRIKTGRFRGEKKPKKLNKMINLLPNFTKTKKVISKKYKNIEPFRISVRRTNGFLISYGEIVRNEGICIILNQYLIAKLAN